MRKASLKLRETKDKVASIRLRPITFDSIEVYVFCYKALIVLGALLVLGIVLGIIFVIFEVLKFAFHAFWAIILMMILGFFFLRMLIVMMVFPSSFGIVRRMVEVQSCSEHAVIFSQAMSLFINRLRNIDGEEYKDVSSLGSFSKSCENFRKLLDMHLSVYDMM